MLRSVLSILTCSCEPLAGTLLASDSRHGQHVAAKVLVNPNHLYCILARPLRSRVRSVALLPQELRSSEERPSPKLPPKDVGPLVDFEGQVAVGGDPLSKGIPYYCL